MQHPSNCILKFGSPQCGPCRTFNIQDICQGLNLIEIDANKNYNMKQRFKITALPTVVVIRDNTEAGRVVGADRIQLKLLIDSIFLKSNQNWIPHTEDATIQCQKSRKNKRSV